MRGPRSRPAAHLAPGLASALLDWYGRNARVLPWRSFGGARASARPDPYAVLVSEAMLCQTTVTAAIPYFARWMRAYPTAHVLAEATEEMVLRSWEGLGYYSRARNLRAAARDIVQRYGGKVPSAPDLLRSLPGVGAYTAGAVASIAFGERFAAVDANVMRVLCRLAAFRGDVRRAPHRQRLERLASRLVPPARPGDFNQALMDLGSLVCTLRDPRCLSCPIGVWCRALRSGQVHLFPARGHRLPATRIEAAIGIVRRRRRILVQPRPAGGLFAGMWEFPGGKIEPVRRGKSRVESGWEKNQDEGRNASMGAVEHARRGGKADAGTRRRAGRLETPEDALLREVSEETGLSVAIEGKLGVFRHSYTRYRVTLHAFICSVKGGRLKRRGARWVSLDELEGLPMPAANRRIVKMLEKTDSPRPSPRPRPGEHQDVVPSRSKSRSRSRSVSRN